MYPPLDLREVTLVAVECTEDRLVVQVRESGRAPGDTISLMRATRIEPCTERLLLEWRDLGTTMLLYFERGGSAVLEGPAASVAGLVAPAPRSSVVGVC
jgi:hypothetical protein